MSANTFNPAITLVALMMGRIIEGRDADVLDTKSTNKFRRQDI